MKLNIPTILLGLAATILATDVDVDVRVDVTATFVYSMNMSKPDCGALAPATTYNVTSGDTLTAIAMKFGVPLCYLEADNPQIANFNYIEIGEIINIPAQTCGTPACVTATTSSVLPTATCANSKNSTYTVQKGDTLFIIATEKFGITLAALELANPQIADFDKIDVGQVINIPDCPTAQKLVRDWQARRGLEYPAKPKRSQPKMRGVGAGYA